MSSIGFSDMNIIEIRDFKGVFSNCDKEDLAPEYLTICKNLIPKNGRLIKTFGFGIKLASALPETIRNFVTYIHDKWAGDKLYVAVRVNDSYSMGLYAWNGAAWVSMSTLENFTLYGAYYHKKDKNPILQNGGILRILPGNTGKPDGSNEAEGVWIGWIDRKVFDEFYNIPSSFYGYATTIIKPSLTVTREGYGDANSIFKKDEIYYYKFSFVYDGVQESLLSSYFRWEVEADNRINILKFQITKSTFNKRITAIKVYRSTNEETDYRYIHTIDLLRKQTDFYGDINGGYAGIRTAYVPGLADYDFDYVSYDYYQIVINYQETPYNFEISDSINGTGNTIFEKYYDTGDVSNTYINEDWKLQGKTEGGEWSDIEGITGNSGCYAGKLFIFVSEDLSGDDIKESYIVFREGNDRSFHKIKNYYENKAVEIYSEDGKFGGAPWISFFNKAWRIFLTNRGSFGIEDGDDVQILFLDRSLIMADEYHLTGEKSIKVNGKFAKIILERLWNANIVLDPGGENEEHNDWISYSEIGQFDVTPVSNVERVIDTEGGEITGLAEIFGNPVILKPMTIITFNAKYYPDEPKRWAIMESIHNIGNIAPQGAISVLDNLYVISYNGIYRLSPSNLSDSDSVPTENLKISGAIQDIFDNLNLTQKKNIKSEYDQYNGEILFTLGNEIWAYNILTGAWRTVETGITVSIMTLDENANILVYDSGDNKVYSSGEKESVKFTLKTKTFVTSDERKGIVRYIYVTYSSATDLTVNLFVEGGGSAVWTGTLPLSSSVRTEKLAIRYRAMKFVAEILGDVASNTDSEIDRINIEIS